MFRTREFIFRKTVVRTGMLQHVLLHRYKQSPPPTRRPTPMHIKHAIAYLCVQPSSWRWTLGFEKCRRQHRN